MLDMYAFQINRFAALFTHIKNRLFVKYSLQNLLILISVHHFLQLAGSSFSPQSSTCSRGAKIGTPMWLRSQLEN